MPYNIVAANTPPVTATSFDYNSKPYPNPWPFPANAVIEGGDPTTSGDHHCLAFDVGNCKLYEVYNILWGSGMTTFTAASGTVWDTTIDDPGNGSGSDAAGLPITPLLIRGDELIGAGAIDHALRFTCAASEQGHIAPARASASSSAGSGVPANPHDLHVPSDGYARAAQGELRPDGALVPRAHRRDPQGDPEVRTPPRGQRRQEYAHVHHRVDRRGPHERAAATRPISSSRSRRRISRSSIPGSVTQD